MKKAGILILIISILFYGCETKIQEYEPALSPYVLEILPWQIDDVALYYYNESEGRLQTEYRAVSAESGDDIAKAVINELILGTQDENLTNVVPYDASLKNIEISNNTANVYFRVHSEMGETQILIMCRAVANTLIDLINIKYVNIYLNDKPVLIGSQPIGAQSYSNEIALSSNLNITIYSETDGLYIADTVNLQKKGGDSDFVESIVDQVAGKSILIYEPIIIEGEVVLSFGDSLTYPDFNALARTLFGFLPDLKEIKIFVNGEDIDEFNRDQMLSETGCFVNVFCVVQSPDQLIQNQALLDSKDYFSPERRLGLLFENSDMAVKVNDIIKINIVKDTAVVDVNSNFQNACKILSEQEETLLIYSIVNTLCDLTGVKQVLFTVNGRMEMLGNNIYTPYPLLKNPGIIKK